MGQFQTRYLGRYLLTKARTSFSISGEAGSMRRNPPASLLLCERVKSNPNLQNRALLAQQGHRARFRYFQNRTHLRRKGVCVFRVSPKAHQEIQTRSLGCYVLSKARRASSLSGEPSGSASKMDSVSLSSSNASARIHTR